MKLTREGAARLGRHEARGFPVGDFEFRPEDFDGCFQNGKDHIALTVEEAKGLLEISRDYRMYLFEHCRIPLSLSVNEAFTALRERIEQAEKCDVENSR